MDRRVSVFVADFTVAVEVAIVETRFAHGALHCACGVRAFSHRGQMAILAPQPEHQSGACSTAHSLHYPAPDAAEPRFNCTGQNSLRAKNSDCENQLEINASGHIVRRYVIVGGLLKSNAKCLDESEFDHL